MRREYQSDATGLGPLFEQEPGRGVAQQHPPSAASDPETAKAAARSEEARVAVIQGTARCLLVLYAHPEGLTDEEIVSKYAAAYPASLEAKGMTGFVRMVMRNWCACKPNGDKRNKRELNLNLIRQTEETRLNRHTGKPNVVFNFIAPPTPEDLRVWRELAG